MSQTNEFAKVETAENSSSQEGAQVQLPRRQPSALSKATSARHSGEQATTPAATQSAGAPLTEPAPLLHFFIAMFKVRKAGRILTEVVEVPLQKEPKRNLELAWDKIRRKYPQLPKNEIRRTGSRAVSRPAAGLPQIPVPAGSTIRQLFPDGTEHEAARQVGTVIFDGALCDVVLRHIRAKGAVSITVRQPGGSSANFSAQYNTQQLASELPRIIAEELDGQGTELKLLFVNTK